MDSDGHTDGSGQDTAEATDAAKFGQDGLDPISPPDEPLGVEDPSIVAGGVIARDDVETRDDRHEPEPMSE